MWRETKSRLAASWLVRPWATRSEIFELGIREAGPTLERSGPLSRPGPGGLCLEAIADALHVVFRPHSGIPLDRPPTGIPGGSGVGPGQHARQVLRGGGSSPWMPVGVDRLAQQAGVILEQPTRLDLAGDHGGEVVVLPGEQLRAGDDSLGPMVFTHGHRRANKECRRDRDHGEHGPLGEGVVAQRDRGLEEPAPAPPWRRRRGRR